MFNSNLNFKNIYRFKQGKGQEAGLTATCLRLSYSLIINPKRNRPYHPFTAWLSTTNLISLHFVTFLASLKAPFLTSHESNPGIPTKTLSAA
jgi:hypothetical protein